MEVFIKLCAYIVVFSLSTTAIHDLKWNIVIRNFICENKPVTLTTIYMWYEMHHHHNTIHTQLWEQTCDSNCHPSVVWNALSPQYYTHICVVLYLLYEMHYHHNTIPTQLWEQTSASNCHLSVMWHATVSTTHPYNKVNQLYGFFTKWNFHKKHCHQFLPMLRICRKAFDQIRYICSWHSY